MCSYLKIDNNAMRSACLPDANWLLVVGDFEVLLVKDTSFGWIIILTASTKT